MTTEQSERLAKRVARDLGIDDWLWVEEAVRRRHRVMFRSYDQVTGLAYELLRDSIEADLADRVLPGFGRRASEARG